MRGDTNFKGFDSSDPSVYFLFCDIVFAFKNKAESEQEADLSDKFLLCIQMIYNLGLLFLKSIIDSVFWEKIKCGSKLMLHISKKNLIWNWQNMSVN